MERDAERDAEMAARDNCKAVSNALKEATSRCCSLEEEDNALRHNSKYLNALGLMC